MQDTEMVHSVLTMTESALFTKLVLGDVPGLEAECVSSKVTTTLLYMTQSL